MDEFSHTRMKEIISNSSNDILDLFSNIPDILSKIYEVPHVFSTHHSVFNFLIDFIKPVYKCIGKQNVQYII